MAGALGCYGAWTVDHVISFLIVAIGQLSEKILEVIKTATKDSKYEIAVHKCESISDIIQFNSINTEKPQLHADIIIFAFDERINCQISEVEKSIRLLDEFFIISGRVILVNCYGSPNTMGLTCHDANKLRDKYCLQLLSANVHTEEGFASLGKKILNYSEALMGLKSGIPNMNMLTLL